MPVDVLFAGVATSELEAARPWYESLVGRPADIVVHEHEIMWRVTDGAWLYLVEDPARTGHALVTLAVPDLETALAELGKRRLATPNVETGPGAGRKAPFVDPEGNTITLIKVSGPAGGP